MRRILPILAILILAATVVSASNKLEESQEHPESNAESVLTSPPKFDASASSKLTEKRDQGGLGKSEPGIGVKSLQPPRTSAMIDSSGVVKTSVRGKKSERHTMTIQLPQALIEEAQRAHLEQGLAEIGEDNNYRIMILARGNGSNIQEIIDKKSKELNKMYNVVKRTHGRGNDAHTHFLISADYLIPHGGHFHRASETARDSGYIFLILVGVMVASQLGIGYWRTKHPFSYSIFALVGLWLFPAFLAFNLGYYRFLVLWTLFSSVCLRLVHLATRRQIHGSTPRKVYTWFLYTYKAALFIAFLGYVLTMLELLGFGYLLYALFGSANPSSSPLSPSDAAAVAGGAKTISDGPLPPNSGHVHGHSHPHHHHHHPGATGFSLGGYLFIFYGLYFGVLGRECAAVCITRMANTIGYIACEGKQPVNRLGDNKCAICDDVLYKHLGLSNKDKEADEKVFTLPCGHAFHEFCLRGWLLVGKRDTCAYCHEKCTVKDYFGKNPWEIQNVLWSSLLDLVQYIIVFNPIIIIATQVILVWVY